MTVPRENRLVRFYIQIQDELKGSGPHSQLSPEALVAMAQRAIEPYKLTYKYCDWWSLYSVSVRLDYILGISLREGPQHRQIDELSTVIDHISGKFTHTTP